MILPMLVLGVITVVIGYIANPQWVDEFGIPKHWITAFLSDGLAEAKNAIGHHETLEFSRGMALVSTLAAFLGIGLAVLVYLKRRRLVSDILVLVKPVHILLTQKYYMDYLYENLMVRKWFYRVFAGTLDWLEKNIIDGTVDLVGWFFRNIGTAIGKFQTGQVQTYATVIAFAVLAIILALLLVD